MNNIRKLEDSYISLDSEVIVNTMKVLDTNKMLEIYNLIALELMDLDELEREFNGNTK